MLDVFLLAKIVLAGGLTAAVVMLLTSRGAPSPWPYSARWSWAIGATECWSLAAYRINGRIGRRSKTGQDSSRSWCR